MTEGNAETWIQARFLFACLFWCGLWQDDGCRAFINQRWAFWFTINTSMNTCWLCADGLHIFSVLQPSWLVALYSAIYVYSRALIQSYSSYGARVKEICLVAFINSIFFWQLYFKTSIKEIAALTTTSKTRLDRLPLQWPVFVCLFCFFKPAMANKRRETDLAADTLRKPLSRWTFRKRKKIFWHLWILWLTASEEQCRCSCQECQASASDWYAVSSPELLEQHSLVDGFW